MRTTLSLLLAFSTTSCFASLFGSNTNVVPITTSNFRTEVIDTDHPVMLMFGTDWCGYCKKLKPEYVKVAANLRGIVKVGAVDCDDPGSRRVCEIHNIKGFPQVKLFGPERTVSKKTGKDSKKVRDYNGERTAKAIVDFALPNVPSYVEPVKDDLDELETFLGSDGNEVPKVLLLSAKAGTTPLYKGLSIQFNKQLKLGQISKVKADESSIAKKYGIEKLPALMVFSKAGEAPAIYEDKLSMDKLQAFLGKFVAGAADSSKKDSGSDNTARNRKDQKSKPAEEEKQQQEEEEKEQEKPAPKKETKKKAEKPKAQVEYDAAEALVTKKDEFAKKCIVEGPQRVCIVHILPPLEEEFLVETQAIRDEYLAVISSAHSKLTDPDAGLISKSELLPRSVRTVFTESTSPVAELLRQTLKMSDDLPAMVAITVSVEDQMLGLKGRTFIGAYDVDPVAKFTKDAAYVRGKWRALEAPKNAQEQQEQQEQQAKVEEENAEPKENPHDEL